jgi:O-antigen ligase
MGIEPMTMFILYPIGLLCLGSWAIASQNKEKIMLVSWACFGLILYLSIRGLYSPLGFGWQEIMRLCAMTGIILSVVDSDIKFSTICKIILVTALIESIFVFGIEIPWSGVQAQTGARGTMATDNKLASFLMVCLPCAYMIGMRDKSLAWKITGKIAIVLIVLMLIESRSRAGITICCMQVIVLSIMYAVIIWGETKRKILSSRAKKYMFTRKTVFLLLPIFFLSMLFLVGIDQGEFKKIKDTSNFHPVYGWVELAGYTKQMISDHPFVGVGAGKWKQIANSMGCPEPWAHTHNELGQCLAEYGIIGVIACIALLSIILLAGLQSPIRLIVIISILLHSFVNCMRSPEDTLYFSLFAGMILQYVFKEEETCKG